jgi:hypothetical protein
VEDASDEDFWPNKPSQLNPDDEVGAEDSDVGDEAIASDVVPVA